MKRIMVCLAMLTLAWMAPRMAAAECCEHCGCQCQCCKVCRLVPDVKKVPKVTYACECEDICIPGPELHHRLSVPDATTIVNAAITSIRSRSGSPAAAA